LLHLPVTNSSIGATRHEQVAAGWPVFIGNGNCRFVLFGFMFRFVAKDAMADFKLVYYGTNCLQHHCDPYRRVSYEFL